MKFKIVLGLSLLSASCAHAGSWFSSSHTVWEIRASATSGNLNGCGFDPTTPSAGTDHTQQDAAALTITDLVIGADAKTVTSVLNPFTTDHIGNYINITAGTGFNTPLRAKIMSVDGSNVATLDAGAGTPASINGTARVGGACSMGTSGANSDDALWENFNGSNTVWIKAGTYSLAAAISISSNASIINPVNIIGYNTTRGDNPTGDDRPLIRQPNLSINLGNRMNVKNIRHIGAGSSASLYTAAIGSVFKNIKNHNIGAEGNNALSAGNQTTVEYSEFISSRGPAINLGSTNVKIKNCYIHHSSIGIHLNGTDFHTIERNVIAFIGSTGIFLNAGSLANNISYNTIIGSMTPFNNSEGISIFPNVGNADNKISKNLIYGWVYGIRVGTFSYADISENNLFNNTNNFDGPVNPDIDNTFVDPQFTNPINGDFRHGANVDGEKYPVTFHGSNTISYPDLGGVQMGGGTKGFIFME